MRDAIPLGRIAGFVVNVHWSVLVILWLFTWSLATMLPGTVGGYPAVVYWLLGAGGAVMLLASLLAHELAHAVVARRAGVSVESVTLWLFGGVTALGGEAKTPKAAFRIAFAGPATSLALSATFGALAITLAGVRTPAIVISVAWWLATVNLLLGLFNLLPGAPLDGGRLVRAYLWRRHGDEEETRISTQQLFAGVRVADAMTAQPHTAPGWINVEDFIQRYVLGERHSAYPVADRDGSITGLVALRQLRDVAPSRRSTTSVGDIALPLHSVPTARPQEPLTALLERMAPLGPRSRALVTEGSAVVGIVTPSDVARLIDVYRLAQPEPTFTTSPQDADRFSDAG